MRIIINALWSARLFVGCAMFFLVVSLLLPSLYVAILSFHQEMVPGTLLLSISASREAVPFPAIVEALLMEITFEALREAGIRLPKQIGAAVSIVGALVIGQAAVQAGLVSAPMVIVVAITGIASFMIPRYFTGLAIRVLRFPMMLLSATLGLLGIMMGIIAIVIHLCSLRSFGVPYLAPIAPLKIGELKGCAVEISLVDDGYTPSFNRGVGLIPSARWTGTESTKRRRSGVNNRKKTSEGEFMKNLFLLLIVCGSILLLSGCWDRVEINDLAIVTAAAIDKKDSNHFELTVQVFLPKALSSGGGQSGGGSSAGAITIVTSEKGINLADALSRLQGSLPRRVFWGQCKVFIFGEEVAKEGIQKHMDFLLRHPQIRERAYLFVGEGKAKQYLEVTPKLERTSSEVIREQAKARIGMDVTMKDLDEMLIGKTNAAALPYLKMVKHKQNPKEPINIPKIFGTAIFRKDQMVGTITERETRGVIWLKNKIKGYTVNVKPEKTAGDVSLDPVSARVKLIPKIQNG